MLPESWQSKSLSFTRFNAAEASLIQEIFESNAHLESVDPTFRAYPIDEYQGLIEDDSQETSQDTDFKFFLRKISNNQGLPVGYVQIELNAPEKGHAWLPMLVLHREHLGHGYGSEAVQSLLSEIAKIGGISKIGLNVYAENIHAFAFWYHAGFRHIQGWSKEIANGKQYNCVTLSATIPASVAA